MIQKCLKLSSSRIFSEHLKKHFLDTAKIENFLGIMQIENFSGSRKIEIHFAIHSYGPWVSQVFGISDSSHFDILIYKKLQVNY